MPPESAAVLAGSPPSEIASDAGDHEQDGGHRRARPPASITGGPPHRLSPNRLGAHDPQPVAWSRERQAAVRGRRARPAPYDRPTSRDRRRRCRLGRQPSAEANERGGAGPADASRGDDATEVRSAVRTAPVEANGVSPTPPPVAGVGRPREYARGHPRSTASIRPRTSARAGASRACRRPRPVTPPPLHLAGRIGDSHAPASHGAGRPSYRT